MRSSVKVIATLVLLLSSNLYADPGRNCWDPSTWGGQPASGGLTELSEMPVAFLNESNVVAQLMHLMHSQTHAEGQAIKLERTQSKDHEIFIFTSTKDFMPPAKPQVRHFTVSIPRTAKGPMDWTVRHVENGAYCGAF